MHATHRALGTEETGNRRRKTNSTPAVSFTNRTDTATDAHPDARALGQLRQAGDALHAAADGFENPGRRLDPVDQYRLRKVIEMADEILARAGRP